MNILQRAKAMLLFFLKKKKSFSPSILKALLGG